MGCPQPGPGTETTSDPSSSTAVVTTSTSGDPSTGATGIQTVTSLPQTSEGSSEGSSGGGSTGSDPCPGAVSGLAAKIAAGEPCEVLVHLDDNKAAQGLWIGCGATGTTWMSAKELGPATQCCQEGANVYSPDPDAGPVWVLFLDNASGGDGVALFSNHTGALLLDAVTGDGAPGTISVPASWLDAATLASGQGCGDPSFTLPNPLSYDLGAKGAALGAGELAGIAEVLGTTALGPALAQASTPVRSVVVRVPLQNGGPPHDFVLLEVSGN